MEKNYKSKYTTRQVTSAQYLAEIMCERQAAHNKKFLKKQFWQDEPWKTKFLTQIRYANSLLKIYDGLAIIKAIHDKRIKNCFSLNAKWIIPILDEYQLKHNKGKVDTNEDIKPIEGIKRPNENKRKNSIDKLKDLE